MTPLFSSRALALLCATAALATSGGLRAQSTPNFSLDSSPSPTATSSAKKADNNPLGISSKDRPKGAKTEITSKDGATFDNATSIATFEGKVVVKDPQFNLFCDKLTVYLRKDRKGIDHAIAEGKVVIVQDNTNDKGEAVKSIGRADKAVFEPATGDVTLSVWPQLQQGINNQVATSAETVMILNRAGRLKTIGGSKATFVDADKSAGSSQ
ncbi:MAG TPA: LptA/OstA family protein [Chthoniobacterales bacterium]|jgi:lipopolysaccharide transport protein LptA